MAAVNRYYAICLSEADLNGLSATNLPAAPHPSDFFEYTDNPGVAASGSQILLGRPKSIWRYVQLTASEFYWYQQTVLQSLASREVFIRTRTNDFEDDAGDHGAIYKKFSAVMHRPVVDEWKPDYIAQDVSIEFTELVEL